MFAVKLIANFMNQIASAAGWRCILAPDNFRAILLSPDASGVAVGANQGVTTALAEGDDPRAQLSRNVVAMMAYLYDPKNRDLLNELHIWAMRDSGMSDAEIATVLKLESAVVSNNQ